MKKSSQKIIVVTTITILAISFLLSSIVFGENGIIQIQLQGAGIGDNLKISAYTFQNSWEWNDTFTISNNLVKQVDDVSIGDVLNLCLINLKEVKEGCSSGTFNSDGIVKINIDLK
jgi:hypothetical protein